MNREEQASIAERVQGIVQQALDLARQGQEDAARTLLRDSWENADTQRPWIALELARAEERAGSRAAARAILEKANQFWPSEPYIATAFARHLGLDGETARSRQLLEAVVADGKATPQTKELLEDLDRRARAAAIAEAVAAIVRQAGELVQQGRNNEARTLLADAWEQGDTQRPWIALELARAEERGGSRAAARAVLEKAHRFWPAEPYVATALARHLLLARETRRSRQLLEAVAAAGKATAQSRELLEELNRQARQDAAADEVVAGIVRQAQESLRHGLEDAACALLRSAWEDPATHRPWIALELARAEERVGAAGESRKVLEEAHALWPEEPYVASALARYLDPGSEAEESLKLLSAVIAAGRGHEQTYAQLARLHQRAGRLEEAIATIDQAEAAGIASAALALQRATILENLKRYDESIRIREEAFARWPDDNTARFGWARALLHLDRATECREVLEPLLASPARDEGYLMVLAVALGAALSEPRIARQALPSRPEKLSTAALDSARQFAYSFINQGHPDSAITLVAELTSLDPGAEVLRGVEALAHLRFGDEAAGMALMARLDAEGLLEEAVTLDLLGILDNMKSTEQTRHLYRRGLTRIRNPVERANRSLRFAEHLFANDDAAGAAEVLGSIDEASLAKAIEPFRHGWLKAVVQGELSADNQAYGEIRPDEMITPEITHFRFGSEACVLWFSGIQPSAMLLLQRYALPIWRKLGVSVMVVNDHRRQASILGFGPHYPDRKAAERQLARIVSDAGYRTVLTTGGSLSGYSAILYGCELDARAVLSFAGNTFFPLTTDEIPDPRYRLILLQLQSRLGIPNMPDLVPLMAARPGTLIHQHYGAASVVDSWLAQRAAELPNVRLFPGDHDRHEVMRWQIERNVLEETITRFVEEALRTPSGSPAQTTQRSRDVSRRKKASAAK